MFLDNLSSHRVGGVLGPIYVRGVYVWFLLVYSPDLDLIEFVWLGVKVVLRKLKVRSFEELRVALKVVLGAIALCDIENWFKHDGYKTMSI